MREYNIHDFTLCPSTAMLSSTASGA